LNKGIKRANGECFLFLNSGDYLFDNEILSKVFSIGFIEYLVTCNIELVYKENRENHNFPEKNQVDFL
jgi:hypothetical protein